jgi:hypothetical protein
MVGGEAPQELMRGWGGPPIRKALRPDHGRKIHATHNLAGGCKKESVGVGRGEGERRLQRRTSNPGSRQEKESNLRPRVFSVSGEGE